MRRRRDERGQLGGVEALPFGILVFVVGTLVVANAWGVVDAKLAAESASREAARAYVEAPDEGAALHRAAAAASEAMRGHGRDPARARVSAPAAGAFRRCNRITFTVEYDVSMVALPWVRRRGGPVITARATHSELVDPYRSGIDDAGDGATCGR